jgi:hypothetical protein
MKDPEYQRAGRGKTDQRSTKGAIARPQQPGTDNRGSKNDGIDEQVFRKRKVNFQGIVCIAMPQGNDEVNEDQRSDRNFHDYIPKTT